MAEKNSFPFNTLVYMIFPYEFMCLVSRGKFEEPQACKCSLGPLWMIITEGSVSKEYSFMELEFMKTNKKVPNTIELLVKKPRRELIKLRFSDPVELRICSNYLNRAIPSDNYSGAYKNEEICSQFFSEKTKIYTAVSKQTKKAVLVRDLPLLGNNALLQLELAMTLTNKCAPKPIKVFIEKTNLKFVYDFFNGCSLAKKLAYPGLQKETSIRSFVIRLLFFLKDLEDNKTQLNSLDPRDILIPQQDIRNPHILNLSQAKKIISGRRPRHTVHLGQILFSIVMLIPYSPSQQKKLKQWVGSERINYCESLRVYDKGLFEVILEMIGGDKTPQQLLIMPWVKYNIPRKGGTLFTIESISSPESENQSHDEVRNLRESYSEEITIKLEEQQDQSEEDDQEDCITQEIGEKLRGRPQSIHQQIKSHTLTRYHFRPK